MWSPHVDPAVILIAPAPTFLALALAPLRQAIEAPRETPEGMYALHRADSRSQLVFLPPFTKSAPLAAIIPLDAETLTRIEALSRFWRAWRGRPVPVDTRITPQQRRRLRLMMQASDGRANNASYREIAMALYGRERVLAEPWKTSALRDAIIGLLESAADMIGGGYLKLLRHRRRD